MAAPLLSVQDLHTRFGTPDGLVRAVDGVSFDVDRGETVCLVGESGSGKTVACESITRLLPTPPAEIEAEAIRFDGEDLSALSGEHLRSYRGDRIAHVFQNPQNALDPVYTVGQQVVEAIQIHRDLGRTKTRDRAKTLLRRVGIGAVEERFDDYPYQFSDGMKQRIVIAMALAPEPDLLIADEPTTALDVTIQKQVLSLLDELRSERGLGLLFVTHDLGVVAEIADRVVVMYAGQVMETGDVNDVLENPSHPYTRALLECLPGRGRGFETIEGTLPDPTDPPAGCRFSPRCPHAEPACETGPQPDFQTVDAVSDVERRDDASVIHDGDSPDATDAQGSGPPNPPHEVSCILYSSDRDLPAPLAGGDERDGGNDE
ncbi:MAG: ABC transporter ATP-binding protein [Haloglomus sp.]